MAESRRREDNTSTATLPVDLLFNVLILLPVNCLLRLKSVSKTWYFLITSREFANLHLRRNSLSYDRLLIFACEDNSLYSVNLATLESHAVKIPFPSISERFSRKNIAGSCNGLLLCICDETPNFEALLLSSSSLPCKRIPKLEVPLDCLYVYYGLGYDCGVDDYKVVKVVHFISFCGSMIGREAMEVMVYSLRDDSWKLVKNNFPAYGTPKSQAGVLLNSNLLHWLFWSSSLDDYRIACFDVSNEEWSEVPMLDSNERLDMLDYDFNEIDDVSDYSTNRDTVDMGVLDGCLCLLIRDYGVGLNVLVMKVYGVKDSWVKLFDFVDLSLLGPLHVAPIAYSQEGGEILLRKDQLSKVFWYDLSEKRVKGTELRGLPDYRRVSTCIRTLIPPFVNDRIYDERWEKSRKDGFY